MTKIISFSRRAKIIGYSLGILTVATILIFANYSRLSHGHLLVDFLNIGQGDAILITTPHNQQILIDGGPDAALLDELGEVMPFFDRTIDLVVLTHPHQDHLGGLIEMMGRYQIDKILLTGIAYQSVFYDEFLNRLKKWQIHTELAESDHDFTIDGLFFDVLYPFTPLTGQTIADLNNSSIVIRAVYGQNEILLAGDAEEPIENLLLKQNTNLQSDILKVGHHGSHSSTSVAFLKAVHPQYAIIQSGEDNRFGHPHRETLEKLLKAGVKYFRNDWDGRVRFVMDEGGILQVTTER